MSEKLMVPSEAVGTDGKLKNCYEMDSPLQVPRVYGIRRDDKDNLLPSRTEKRLKDVHGFWKSPLPASDMLKIISHINGDPYNNGKYSEHIFYNGAKYTLAPDSLTGPNEYPTTNSGESDPNKLDQHTKGAKLDAGKLRASLVLGGFSNALTEVVRVGTDGAKKYTDNGWKSVPNGIERYTDAMHRHQLAEWGGEYLDKETEIVHAAHLAWNALARLELILMKNKSSDE